MQHISFARVVYVEVNTVFYVAQSCINFALCCVLLDFGSCFTLLKGCVLRCSLLCFTLLRAVFYVDQGCVLLCSGLCFDSEPCFAWLMGYVLHLTAPSTVSPLPLLSYSLQSIIEP